jgi:hypothetical protein
MPMGWYRDDLAARGLALDVANLQGSRILAAAEQIFVADRRLFVDRDEGALIAAYPHYAYGTLLEILPRGTPVPSLDRVLELQKQLYEGFATEAEPPRAGDEWPAFIHLRYAVPWGELGDQLKAAGRADDARYCYNIANALAPQP